ncbi:hypothetical protein ACJQWK_01598 [Exserohilum turcicum]|uniref:Uncharacterized protein n=1 Tax=Exserohilum turcicum (strain 28A) TaxID=671987 RepID=R0KFH4_EXST2|nr:uncharacterized protein SETTUDRAFT_38750 [Exserohilum turcica Et28A]EOA88064.1 hypothetical protein SETTUDRAFT_38750 [Exserohilum turcica Et28A]
MDLIDANGGEPVPFAGRVMGPLVLEGYSRRREEAPANPPTVTNDQPAFLMGPLVLDGYSRHREASPPRQEVSTPRREASPPLDREIPSPCCRYYLDEKPPYILFSRLSRCNRYHVMSLYCRIIRYWDVMSPATPFPVNLLPDPDPRNWGSELLSRLLCLAEMTRSRYRVEGVDRIFEHIIMRNCLALDHEVVSADLIHGDFVIRLPDVEYAIDMMRTRIHTLHPGEFNYPTVPLACATR